MLIPPAVPADTNGISGTRSHPPSDRRPSRTRARLWQAGGLLAVMFVTFFVGNLFLPSDRAVTRSMLGYDFSAFYTGGMFVRQGRADLLYDLDAVRAFEVKTFRDLDLPPPNFVGPWWNPPFYAWVFAPLAALPFQQAMAAWTGVTLVCLAISVFLLCRMLVMPRGRDDVKVTWLEWALVPLFVVMSMPFVQAVSHGQNTFTSLLLVTLTVAAWRARRGLMAGLIVGLLFYKPQLGAVLAGMLMLTLGWRALVGVGITGVVLLAVNLITLPGTLSTYSQRLPSILHFMQVEKPYLWERHATLKAFWRLLLQGRGPGEAIFAVQALTALGCGTLALGLLASVRCWRNRVSGVGEDMPSSALIPETRYPTRGSPSLDAIIVATITAMPLLMPFYFDYDLMLMAVPAVLLAGERLRETETVAVDRWLLRAWAAFFLWLLVNPGMASMTHVNLTVPLLLIVAGLSIRRALRSARLQRRLPELSTPQPAALAA